VTSRRVRQPPDRPLTIVTAYLPFGTVIVVVVEL
jgi:hypothetical protein